ncbi:TnsA endonuclease N-terminal domain-containing protein [Chryseobacterium sp.]|uniref:TnsA endonuclease N-terminal domain-containing protein n=1 Tax=Chryseobacterium sp. TaxID=1871047 RepID=UPI0025C0AFD4|nr:TnsA endonuclease N-terminal domain-containing protein [Chryseobacterium sp.]
MIWFDKIKKWEKSHFNEIESKRVVKADIRYKSDLFYSEKMRKEIQYESGAELKFIEQLESSSLITAYVEQPVTIKYVKNKKEYVYTPDFAVLLNNGSSFIAEIKGSFESLIDAGVHRNIEQLLSYCQEYGFGLLLSCKLRAFEYFTECSINKKLELKILANFRNGRRIIFLNEFKAILEETGASKKEALALILHNNWGYYSFPFKLTSTNPYPVFRKTFIEKLL